MLSLLLDIAIHFSVCKKYTRACHRRIFMHSAWLWCSATTNSGCPPRNCNYFFFRILWKFLTATGKNFST